MLIRVRDGLGNADSEIEISSGADATGPIITLTHTNSEVVFLARKNQFTIDNVYYDWPNAQGANSTALTNDGSGNLGWWPITVGAGSNLTTNENQFGASVILTIKDGAFLTNLNVETSLQVSNGHTYLAGPVTNLIQLNLPHLTASRSAIINAQNDLTNSAADANWSLYNTNVWNSRQGGSALLSNLVNNPYTGYTNQVFGGTNISVRTAGGTNFIDVVSLAGGAVTFGDLVWTNKLGTLYPNLYPTNIVFNPTNTGAGGMSTVTNFLFQTSTRRTGGTNMLLGVFNGAASAFVVGDQGVMIGSTNHILVPQAAIDIAYDMAFGIDSPEKSILLTTYHSGVGYSGNAELHVSTNYGDFNVTANKEGNGFVQYFAKAGGDAAFINFDSYVLIQNEGATIITPLQFDPDFSLSPTSYIFGSTMRITNIHTLMSLTK
jgi:hypothetical protein